MSIKLTEKLKIEDKHVISVTVDNEFGTLARVVSLFSARGYNIESLSVAVIDEEKNLSNIIITTYGSQETIDLIVKLLNRLIPVHHVIDFSSSCPHVERILILVKVKVTKETRDEIIRIGNIHEAKLVDKEKDYFLLQMADRAVRVKDFVKLLEPYGIIDISVSGSAALPLG
jgi:acetolactate synthase-1/3 small subunit